VNHDTNFWLVFRELLHSVHLDVSYFAAGIVAHLASDGAETWTVPTISRQDVLDELVNLYAMHTMSVTDSGFNCRAMWF
jgi:hypothetical protein